MNFIRNESAEKMEYSDEIPMDVTPIINFINQFWKLNPFDAIDHSQWDSLRTASSNKLLHSEITSNP